jgi:hypothetical protein
MQTDEVKIGHWYIDGFHTSNIITPVRDENYQRGIRWVTVRRCVSREIAEIRCKQHNKSL